jgi:hypothetical protein
MWWNIMYSWMKMEKWHLLKLFQDLEEEDKGQWWRGEFHYGGIYFVNVTTYPQHNNNFKNPPKKRNIKRKKIISTTKNMYLHCSENKDENWDLVQLGNIKTWCVLRVAERQMGVTMRVSQSTWAWEEIWAVMATSVRDVSHTWQNVLKAATISLSQVVRPKCPRARELA